MHCALILAAALALSSPASVGSAEPHLTTTRSGALVLSWLEPAQAKRHALKLAMYEKGKWSEPLVVAERDDFFVNWADFPSVVEDAKGTLFAHWLQKSGASTYAYDVWITSSRNGGKTWTKPKLVNRDGKEAEHGFVSMVPLSKSGIGIVWLDGRDADSMSVRYAEVDAALNFTGETVLDAKTCECCGTAMAMTSRGPLVAYRDRSDEEIRDISIARRSGGKWSAPVRVHADDWKINGCPVNGPQLAARGNATVLAWFTSANDAPRVNVAFSNDGGASFGKAVRVDGGKDAVGRVEALMLADGSSLVVWIEGAGQNAGVLMRRVWPNGRLGEVTKLASTSAARAAGFPRGALLGDSAYFAWTDPGEKRVRVARVPVK